MTPDQVQKDLELVLAAANELTQLSDIELESDQPIRAAITRLRSVKLVAVEEAPEKELAEVLIQRSTGRVFVMHQKHTAMQMSGEVDRYLYAGTVTIDENGKVDG